MDHYYPNVPGLGNVAVSRHAQDMLRQGRIPEETFKNVLFNGEITPEGFDIVWRQHNGLRIVILRRPTPFRGAMLVKTVFKIEAQAKVK